MMKLLDMPQSAAPIPCDSVQQAMCQRKNVDKTTALAAVTASGSRQMMPLRQNLPTLPQAIGLHCSDVQPMLGEASAWKCR
jgi:hypothetical protein